MKRMLIPVTIIMALLTMPMPVFAMTNFTFQNDMNTRFAELQQGLTQQVQAPTAAQVPTTPIPFQIVDFQNLSVAEKQTLAPILEGTDPQIVTVNERTLLVIPQHGNESQPATPPTNPNPVGKGKAVGKVDQAEKKTGPVAVKKATVWEGTHHQRLEVAAIHEVGGQWVVQVQARTMTPARGTPQGNPHLIVVLTQAPAMNPTIQVVPIAQQTLTFPEAGLTLPTPEELMKDVTVPRLDRQWKHLQGGLQIR